MPTGRRRKPKHLAGKLRKIREDYLGMSQTQIAKHLGLPDRVKREKISAYETGEREPDLLTLLAYVRAVKGLTIDDLVDDNIKLPEILPAGTTASSKKSINKK
jgi:transcriptional regulator with XRE-family HTH domain